MKLSVVASVLVLASSAFGAQCTKPLKRKEWRTFSGLEKFAYLAAVRCLQILPAKSKATVPGAKSRFDDFVGNHILQTDTIHFVGHFQPRHSWQFDISLPYT